MNRNTKLYQDFVRVFTSANPSKSSITCQVEANEYWKNKIKEGKSINIEKYNNEMEKLKTTVKKIEDKKSIV